jgi:DNA-binding MarR family transcriptional regulator
VNCPGCLDFTTPPKVRKTDPETAQQAWIKIIPKVGTQRYRLLEALRIGDSTQDELAAMTGMKINSVSTRLSELLKAGWIEVTGDERNGQRVVRRIR